MVRTWKASITLQRGVWRKLDSLARTLGQSRIEDVLIVGARGLASITRAERGGATHSQVPRSGKGKHIRVVADVDSFSPVALEESSESWSQLEARTIRMPWREGMEIRRIQRALNLTLEQLVIAAANGVLEQKTKPGQGYRLTRNDEEKALRRGEYVIP